MSLKKGSKIYKAFKNEYSKGNVNVSSKCNLSCFYCSQNFNPPILNSVYNGFLSLEDIKHFLTFSPKENLGIHGADVDGVSTGEFFLHPQALEILQYLKDEGFEVGYIDTNGVLLKEEHAKLMSGWVKRLGVHVTDYKMNKHSLKLLDKYGLNYLVCIVPTRTEIENGTIAGWIKELQKHKPSAIRILKPGYTKYSPPDVVKEMDISNEEINFLIYQWQKGSEIKIEYQVAKLVAASLLRSLSWYERNKQMYSQKKDPKVLFLISKAVEGIFKPLIEGTPIKNYRIQTVTNKTFGGSCDQAGLLLNEDYIEEIEGVIGDGYVPELMVASKKSFVEGCDLKGRPASNIAEKFKIPMMWC